MKNRDTLHSFQDIAAARGARPGKTPDAAIEAPKRTEKKREPAPADIADESALFLEAVAGALDVTLKNPPPPNDAPDGASNGASDNAPGNAVDQPPGPPHTIPREPLLEAPIARSAPEKTTLRTAPEEMDVFSQAMHGVTPIRSRGRELVPPVKPVPAVQARTESMADVFSGKLEFALEYTDEFAQGHVLGLDPIVLGKLRAGAYSPEGHIDLHGCTLEQAYAALAVFVKEAYQGGKRHLLVITGRGKNSPGGTPILRERVQAWFTRDPFKRVVLAFCSAKSGDGGAGALYLLLRKRKKNQGKIFWDRNPSEEELLL